MTGNAFLPTGLPAPGVVILGDGFPASPDERPPIPLFEGATACGPINDPQLCRSLAEWADTFGVSSPMENVIGYGVREFFMQGGDCCYFKRIEMTP